MANKNTTLPTSKIPTKWLAIIVFVLVGYGLCQPFLNRKFGWQLPSVASVLGFQEKLKKAEDQQAKVDADKSKRSGSDGKTHKPDSTISAEELENQLLSNDAQDDNSANKSSDTAQNAGKNSDSTSKAGNKQQSSPPPKTDTAAKSNSSSQPSNQTQSGKSQTDKTLPDKTQQANSGSTKSNAAAGDEKLKFGLLKDLGRENYLSPAGLRYTRGSEEGHRLKHIERHLEDQPDRPGNHGVFDGDMPQVLRWIDDAFTRGKSGAKGTTSKAEDDGQGVRTVYEVNFSKPIGYVGGRDGARKNNPPAKRLRLVVDEDLRVITAFPF